MRKRWLTAMLAMCMLLSAMPVESMSMEDRAVTEKVVTESEADQTTKKDEKSPVNDEASLEFSGEVLSPPLTASPKEEVRIASKDALLELFKAEVEDKNIILDRDIEITSDEVQAVVSGIQDKNPTIDLLNSNFDGNGKTITLKRGTRDIHSLFGDIWATEGTAVKNLNIIYDGDVIGAGFAQSAGTYDTPDKLNFSQIKIQVKGNVLPLIEQDEIYPGRTNAMATGFLLDMNQADVTDLTLEISGDIGSIDSIHPVNEEGQLVYASSSAFVINNGRIGFKETKENINNLDIKIGGSILAKGSGYRSEATGLGINLENKEFRNVALSVKDIRAVADGVFDPFDGGDDARSPMVATAGGKSLYNLEDAVIEVAGSIEAVNSTSLSPNAYGVVFDTMALGLGSRQSMIDSGPVMDLPKVHLAKINLKVGGNILAKSTFEEVHSNYPPNPYGGSLNTIASGGFVDSLNMNLFNNNMPGMGKNLSLEFSNDFTENNLIIGGDIQADAKSGSSKAWFWGDFKGSHNKFAASSIQAINPKGEAMVAPLYQFFKGSNNSVQVSEGIIADSLKDSAAGFANFVTTYQGEDGNSFATKSITVSNPRTVGGFAGEITNRVSDIGVPAKVSNVHIEPVMIFRGDGVAAMNSVRPKNSSTKAMRSSSGEIGTFNAGDEYPLMMIGVDIGGFVGFNEGEISHSSTTLSEPMSMTLRNIVDGTSDEYVMPGEANIGGFAGTNMGKIDGSAANVKSIKVEGVKGNEFTNNFNVGGFVGLGGFIPSYDGSTREFMISNSSAFTEDSITVNSGTNVYLGGFAGVIDGQKLTNNAAQVGENLVATKNSETDRFPTTPSIGGFAGELSGTSPINPVIVERCTSLVFGDILGEAEYNGVVAGFAGSLKGQSYDPEDPQSLQAQVKDAASYVGGKIQIDGDENYVATGIGDLSFAELTGFSALVNLNDKAESSQDAMNLYLGFVHNASFKDNYLVEVKDANRKAFPITLSGESSDLKFTKGDVLGQIDIAPRKLQASYWGKDVDRKLGAYKDFDYVKKNDKKIALLGIASGSEGISKVPFDKATLPDFYTRHLALLSEAGPIYDILGIPAGKFVEPEPTPEPKPTPPGISFIPGIQLNTKDHYQYLIGYKDNTFRPENNMTREEVTTMFSRLLVKRPEKGRVYDYDFTDVSRDRWSITAISYMNKLGIIKGYEDGEFKPGRSITRAEFAAIATRFADLKLGDTAFTDVPKTHWAYEEISKAATAGWINGYPDGSFKPDQPITRAEVVTLVNKMLNRYGDHDFIVKNESKLLHFSDIKEHWAFDPIVEATNGHDYTRRANGKDENWKKLTDKSFVYDK